MEINKTKLTGGTLFVIALIVLIFSNGKNKELEEKLDDTYKVVQRIENRLYTLERKIEALKTEKNSDKSDTDSADKL